MKLWVYIIFFFTATVSAQPFYIKIKADKEENQKIIDSLSYKTKHEKVSEIIIENENFKNKLKQIGFFESILLENKKINDSTFTYTYNLGSLTKNIEILFDEIPEKFKDILQLHSKNLKLNTYLVEETMQNWLQILEKKGYALSKLSLKIIEQKNQTVYCLLQISSEEEKRVIDKLVIVGYEKFPIGIKKVLEKKARANTFNKENIEKLYKDINQMSFINQVKYPEILFTKDSTQLYIYAEKIKANTFDGLIGFANNENSKIRVNGYADLVLQNILNTGEKFSINWKNDGNKQSTFNMMAEIPYIFKTSFITKANIRIFKQDSTFQNTQLNGQLGYALHYHSRIYLGYEKTTSSVLNNSLGVNQNFTNYFTTASYRFIKYTDDNLFREKFFIDTRLGIGKRKTELEQIPQHFFQIKSYLFNELYRFGGINSVRGFNENSLQANILSAFITEYRYKLSPTLYTHSIIDYGYFKDNATNTTGKIMGVGVGLGMLTKTGLLNIIYANGNTEQQTFKLSNSVVHFSLKAYF